MSAQAPRMPRSGFGRGRVHAVAGCCSLASFAALGPPYPTETLPELSDRNAHWAGVLHVVPAAPVLIGGAAAAVTAALLPTPHLRTRWSH
ncbi:hypothetical protein ACWCQZ_36255 [Streptomyces sp. NPDC002285]|uniref:hypothetical protein n=1 Tax=Streptomyces sp. NPDC056462 TaxID=3345826 RepID=UPI00369DC2D9